MALTLFNFPANSFVPSTAAGSADAQFHVVNGRPVIAFDDTTVEDVHTPAVQLPANYAGGALTAKVCYIMASATSGKVDFEVSVEAVTSGDATDLDAGTSFDTLNAANETVPATAGYMSVLSVVLTNDDGHAAGDSVTLMLQRDANDGTNDTATGDCYVLWMAVEE